MLNKKGITITEIIISVALISLVIIMVIQVLVDIRYEDIYTKDKGENMVNQALAIKAIQDDIINKGLKIMACSGSKLNNTYNVKFTFKDNSTSDLKFNSTEELVYNKEVFALETGTNYLISDIKFISKPVTADIIGASLVIPVKDKQDNNFNIEVYFIYNNGDITINGCL